MINNIISYDKIRNIYNEPHIIDIFLNISYYARKEEEILPTIIDISCFYFPNLFYNLST